MLEVESQCQLSGPTLSESFAGLSLP